MPARYGRSFFLHPSGDGVDKKQLAGGRECSLCVPGAIEEAILLE